MRLWLAGEFAPSGQEGGQELDRERSRAELTSGLELPLYEWNGLSVRMRFIVATPPPDGPGVVMPDLVTDRPVPELADYWARVLEGVLWRDAGQIVQLFARREYGRASGLEVSL